MKEKFILEISNAMAEILSLEQIAQLNGVLLQVVSKYIISVGEEKSNATEESNEREACTPMKGKAHVSRRQCAL